MRFETLSSKGLLVSTAFLIYVIIAPIPATAQFVPSRPARHTLAVVSGPTADAGPSQLAVAGTSVLLDGSSSISSTGLPLSYKWTFVSAPSGSSPVLSNPSIVNPLFSIPQDGTYVLELTVSDGEHSSTSQVTISTQFTPPVADAGENQFVLPGKLAHLAASHSFDWDGAPLAFKWTLSSQPAGSFASISNTDAIAPTFFVDVPGTYVAQLTVTDSHNLSSTDSVTISTVDVPPNAVAGDWQRVAVGATVHLNAAASSDPNGDPITFTWSMLSRPAGSAAVITGVTSVTPTFVADLPGSYVLQLEATDSHGNISLSTVEVTTDPKPPKADAGPGKSVSVGDTVVLNGSASADDSGAPISYQWALLAKPSGSSATISPSVNSPTPSFIADKPGEYLAQLMVSNGVYTSTPSTVLINTGTTSGLIISPNPLMFGNQEVHTTSGPAGLTVTNPTNATVQVTGFLTTGANPGDFNILNLQLPLIINPSTASIVKVLFTPGDSGPRSANLIVNSDTGGSPNIVQMIGTGGQGIPVIGLVPPSLAFGDQAVNTLSAPLRVTVNNTGDVALLITALSFAGTNSADFSFPLSYVPPSPGAPLSVPANGSISIPVIFAPKSTGVRSATLLLMDNAAGNPHSVGLGGNGVPGTGPINVTPATLNFPDQAVGVASAPLLVTVTNTGTTSVKVTSLSFTGTNNGDFSTAVVTPITVPANGGTATIPVKFTPGALGARSATLTVFDDSGGNAHTVALSGNGASTSPGLDVNPLSINFPNQAVNTTSSPVPVTITNNTSGPVQILSLLLTGTNATDFLVNGARAPFTLAVGASTIVNVLFSPKDTGPRSATVLISDDTTGAYHRVALTGNNGGNPGISFSPTSLSFSDQLVGTTSAAQSVTVSNPGDATLVITGLTFGGANAGEFVFPANFVLPTSASPLSIPAKGSASIPVSFRPATMGPRSATLLVTDNAAGSPQPVALGGNGVPGGTGPISVTPGSLTFADQMVGVASAPLLVTVTNTGTTPVNITLLGFTGTNNSDFSTTAVTPMTVPANGGTVTIPVKFTPGGTGPRSATLTVTDDSGSSAHMVALSGNGTNTTPPGLNVNPSSIDFPTQAVNTTSSPVPITITNNYPTTVNIFTLLIVGNNSGDFSLTGVPGPPDDHGGPYPVYTIAAGASVSFRVLFTPRADGPRSATLLISDDIGGGYQRVVLTGNDIAGTPGISFTPTSLTFGDQAVGTTSAAQSLTVSNPGDTTLMITGLSFGGMNAGDFVFPANFVLPTSASPLSIAAKSSAAIPVSFKPTATGARSATLMVTDNAAGSPQPVALGGNGVPGGTGPITVSPASLTFADQTVGVASAPLVVTVTNNGTTSVNVTSLGFTGTNSGDFSSTAVTPITVTANGGTATIPVKFTPGATGARSATLTVTDDSGSNAHTVTLSGNGTLAGLTFAPSAIDFQNQTINVTSSPLSLLITNNSGAVINVTGMLLAGMNAADFTVTNSRTPFPVNPGETRTLNVLFMPKDLGPRSATMIFYDDQGGSAHAIVLTGIGATSVPTINFMPMSLTFAGQGVGTNSAPSTITITNSGNGPLLIKGLGFTGPNAGDFGFPSTFTLPTPASPITVPANTGSATIPVIFQPTASGLRSAMLAITDNANFSPQSVSLSGTGTAPSIIINPKSLSFAEQAVGTASAPSNLTITNGGNGELRIIGLAFAGMDPGDYTFSLGFTVPTPASPMVIPAGGGMATIPVVFKPTVAGLRPATLMITSNAPGSPPSADLSGNGIDSSIKLDPPSLLFGQQLRGSASAPLAVTVTNTGKVDFQITGLSFTGANPMDFATQESGTINVPANGGTAILHLIFTPGDIGNRSAALSITDTAPGSPHLLQVAGVGIFPGISITPTTNDFGIQDIGVATAAVSFLVRNTGSAPLHIKSVTLGGANPGDFSTSTPGPFTVDSNNATVTLQATFTPTAKGPRSATLILDDDAGGPHSVTLSGTGRGHAVFTITPTSLDFGAVAANTTSPTQLLRISNPGSDDLQVDFVSRVGNNPGEFRYTVLGSLGSSDFPETIPPGGHLDMTVAFSPSDGGGPRSATFVFNDNAPDNPQSVKVTGSSIPSPPAINLSPASLSFPSQQVNTTSGTLVITVKNTGGADLTISSIQFTGPNGSEFSVAPLAPLTITSGNSSTLNVTFTPKDQGLRTATLTLNDNAGGGPHTDTIAVSGTGAPPTGNISLPNFSLGGNLEMLVTAALDQVPGTDLQVTITSSDPTKILLSPVATDPNGTQAGVASFTGIVPKGQGKFGIGFPGFWVQSKDSSGSAQITVSAQNYTSGVATVTLTHSGFVLNSSLGAGVNFTTTLGKDAILTVAAVQLDNSGNVIAGSSQVLRGNLVANVNVTSGTPGTGTVVGNPAILQSGKSTSSQVTFHPVAAGTSTLSITQPNGFFSPASNTSLTATVNVPSILLVPQSIGYNLIAQGSGQLDTAAPAGGVSVTLTSSDPSKVVLSTSPAVSGLPSITLPVGAGNTALPVFYLQALSGTGMATITGSATGYTSGTAPVALFPTAVVINSPNDGGDFTTTTISAATQLTLSLWQLDKTFRPFMSGQLRPGAFANVTVGSTNTGAGDIAGNPAQFNPGDATNSSLFFLPSQNCSAPCVTTLAVTQPSGYTIPATGGQIKATVNQPMATIRLIQSTIGKNLQVTGSGALDAPAPSDLQVTITSNNPNVLLSTSPTVMGTSSITSIIQTGSGVNSIGFPTYFVQALANTGTGQLTVSVPGYASSSFTVTLAPSGLVLVGPNGIGADFGVLMSNGNVALTATTSVLDSITLMPTVVSESVRGGFSVMATATSSASDVAVLQDSSVMIAGGASGTSVVMIPTGPGSTTISLSVPDGFSTPTAGGHLKASVN